ncbi:MAG: hypothetical protein LBR38_06995 [Synergistaceae bacterium]|jgi:hypothetical protein|nr:hypothetical protein [Synergistaceae bacterium]
MSELEKYMNDPYVADEPMPMRMVHAIRFMLMDEMKDMTPEARVELINKRTEALVRPTP